MRVEDVGELIDGGTFWRLVYDNCGHVQEFAREGLDELEHAAQYVRRQFAHCLTCASNEKLMAAETINVVPDEIHVVLSPGELTRIIEALRQCSEELLAQCFARILQPGRSKSATQPESDS